MTPSAISQRIRALENTVGGVLLRRTKPITATPTGTTYLRLARQIETLSADAVREAAQETAGSRPAVSLAINGDSLATWVLSALAELANDMFPRGADATSLVAAPVVVFDAKDDHPASLLTHIFAFTGQAAAAIFPASVDFAVAVRLGFGWAMLRISSHRSCWRGETSWS